MADMKVTLELNATGDATAKVAAVERALKNAGGEASSLDRKSTRLNSSHRL